VTGCELCEVKDALFESDFASVLALLNRAKRFIEQEHRPDGYNIGVRCVLARKP